MCQSNEFDFHLKQHKNNDEVLLLDPPQKERERERERVVQNICSSEKLTLASSYILVR